jgi:hypothetical protein
MLGYLILIYNSIPHPVGDADYIVQVVKYINYAKTL